MPGCNAIDLEELRTEVMREACRRAGAVLPYDRTGLDEPLLEATPNVRGLVGYVGPRPRQFEAAYVHRHPHAQVCAIGATDEAPPLDALALGEAVSTQRLVELVRALKPGGWLVARGGNARQLPQAAVATLEAQGLRLGPVVDLAGTGIFRASRPPLDGSVAEPMCVAFSAWAPRMMDIRTRLPTQALQAAPDVCVHYATPVRTLPPLAQDVPKVLILQRQAPHDPAFWTDLLASLIAKGWLAIAEFDDHPWLVAKVLGNQPVDADLTCFGYVHAVQTSTEPLAALFRIYNPQVAVFPNALFDAPPFSATRERRVFYGGVGRGAFVHDILRSLSPVIERYPDTTFVVVGDEAAYEAIPTARKVLHPFLSYEAYLGVMSGCSVSLSPIDDDPMLRAKSDAKFLDASRCGALTIASPTVYGQAIRHGENGWIARTTADWSALLTRAFDEPGAAEAMARRAWEGVRQARMLSDQAEVRAAWYRDLWARRDELNEALMERLPGLREAVERRRRTITPHTNRL